MVKTVGLVEPLRVALTPHASKIPAAFVYGSAAAGGDRATSDIDVMVISDKLAYADVYDALQPAEQILARPVNPTVVTTDEWRKKRARSGSFVARLAVGPKLFVLGGDNDIP